MRPTEEQKLAWQASRPRKSIAVKTVITSDAGNILLVIPHHQDAWQFPGGSVEAHEEPKAALLRELKEELSLEFTPQDFVIAGTAFLEKLDVLLLMYTCLKTVSEDTTFVFQQAEMSGYQFVAPKNVLSHVHNYYTDFWEDHTK